MPLNEDNESPDTRRSGVDWNTVKDISLHIVLFVVTFFTTVLAGYEWIHGDADAPFIVKLHEGLPYAGALFFFLLSHEFGHYFAAKIHKVKATLPYFIPYPPLAGFAPSFGTMGAVIRTKSGVPDKKALFDIGASGPIAGFIACLIILTYGFTHLPGKEYILQIHPDYYSPDFGKNGLQLIFGDTILFSFFRMIFQSHASFMPPMSEIYHYPYLCVGWFGLFVTTLNLCPVGQLDGGHIFYAMFGEKPHNNIAGISMILIIILGVLGTLQLFVYPQIPIGWAGWMAWAGVLLYFMKIHHPPIYDPAPLDRKRKIIGWIAIVIFILSFTPSPFIIR
jgi:membrane-associated protease RseP (regulator of RpoE activity)